MSQKINCYFLSLNPDAHLEEQWDCGFLLDLLSGGMWQTPEWPGFNINFVNELPLAYKPAIVAVAARHHAGKEHEVNRQLQGLEHIVLFLMGDEEASFAVEKIDHPSIHIWVQNPHPGRHDEYNKLGTGYPPHARELLLTAGPTKRTDVFFAGQVTHDRRQQLVDNMGELQSQGKVSSEILITRGFTQGFTPLDYYLRMARTKVAPAPAGAVIPDSFRLYEALDAMTVPIADDRNSQGTIDNYWDWLFGQETPFPKIKEWDRFVGMTEETLQEWPANMHTITAWWIKQKRDFAYKVMEQLNV